MYMRSSGRAYVLFLYVGMGECEVVMMCMSQRDLGRRSEVGLDVCGCGYGVLFMGVEGMCVGSIYLCVSRRLQLNIYYTHSPTHNKLDFLCISMYIHVFTSTVTDGFLREVSGAH